jgi:hypothetical protein
LTYLPRSPNLPALYFRELLSATENRKLLTSTIMRRIYGLSILLLLFLCAVSVSGSYGLTLTWNLNTEKDLGGYKLYYGTSSRQYSTVRDVGKRTSFLLDQLFLYEHLPYFIAVTAYDTTGNESAYSGELSWTYDDYVDYEDNCPDIYNPDQKDTYPPSGNEIGDACDCEGDFTCDGDVDGWDATLFQADLWRNRLNHPCTNADPCNGDFDCDGDVDGWDNAMFKADANRNPFSKPCPLCAPGEWCRYPQ